MEMNGFEPCSRNDMSKGRWSDTVRNFYKSGEECAKRVFDSGYEAMRVRGSLVAAVQRLGLPVKVSIRIDTVYLVRIDEVDCPDERVGEGDMIEDDAE